MHCLKRCLQSIAPARMRNASSQLRRFSVTTGRMTQKLNSDTEANNFPRKIFSGIQPTGGLHLGNYLGVVTKWAELQNNSENVTFCIVDMHSITLPQNPVHLRDNIFQVAATMLACGIDFERSTVFVQSAIKEHTELSWILCCLTTMARLGHLPQYKEKARSTDDIPLGLFVYPVLQAADIMLHKATHVPVGGDQIQHIQLAQHLTRTFNGKYGVTFPTCTAMIENKTAARIRSLRDPSKKMSKSDTDPKATIFLTDEPEVIVEKIKKGVTDFCSDVAYEPDKRLGVSNLIAIHSLVTGESIQNIVEEAKSIDTGKYKLRVADAVVEHLQPIREKIKFQISRKNDLMRMLEIGAERGREAAQETMYEVKQRVGLGAMHTSPFLFFQEETKSPVNIVKNVEEKFDGLPSGAVIVPKQRLRVEKRRNALPVEAPAIKMMPVNIRSDKTNFKMPFQQKTNDMKMNAQPKNLDKSMDNKYDSTTKSTETKSQLENIEIKRTEQVKQ